MNKTKMVAAFGAALTLSLGAAPALPTALWNREELFKVPAVEDCEQLTVSDLRAVWLDGEPFKGKPTKVFAYVALPKGASADRKVPGMVLVHGGLGSAYARWARLWASRGYAAIAMDTCGSVPVHVPGTRFDWMKSPVGGPSGWAGYGEMNGPVRDHWVYHAVSAVVRAHSFLRSLPEVDADRTGITGISWGSFLTFLAAAVDDRFRFAAPVYGCPFYDRAPTSAAWLGDPLFERWCALFDPKHFLPLIRMPVLWVAGTNDHHFPFDCLEEGFGLLPSYPTVALRVRMGHSHGWPGENPPEIFAFADRCLRNGRDYPTVGKPVLKDGAYAVGFDAKGHSFARAEVNWTEAGTGDWRDRPWNVATNAVDAASGRFACAVPPAAKALYVNFVFDEPSGDEHYTSHVLSAPAIFR